MKRILEYIKYVGKGYDEEPEAGHLAYAEKQGKDAIHRTSEWYHCRETFHNHFNDKGLPRQFLFFCDDKGSNVECFIKEVEKRLEIKEPTEIIGFTKVSNICCIFFSPWWKKNEARWQLFTILLRCGLNDGRTFRDILYSHDYTNITTEAVERFFKGYTHFTGKMGKNEGWVSNFDRDEFLEENGPSENDEEFYEGEYADFNQEKFDKACDKAWQKQLERLRMPPS